MKNFVHASSIALCLVACSSSPEERPNIADHPEHAHRVVTRIPGGGSTGGPINGKLAVFVENDARQPLADATVLVEVGATSLTKVTNTAGLVELEDAALVGPVAVHVFRAGHQTTSMYGLDASVVTVGIDPDETSTPVTMPKLATISGRIIGLESLPPAATRMAVVQAFGDDLTSVEQDRRMDGSPQNVAMTSAMRNHDDYALSFDVGAKGVAVLAGGLGADSSLAITHLGLLFPISATEGATIEQRNIELTHELSRNVEVAVEMPAELTQRSLAATLELPAKAGSPVISFVQDGSTSIRVPVLDRELTGGRIKVIGQFSRADQSFSNWSIRFVDAGDQLAMRAVPAVGVPKLEGRQLSAEASTGATFHYFTIMDAQRRVVWDISVIGGSSVRLPEVPSAFVDPLTLVARIQANALHIEGVDPQNLVAAELLEQPMDATTRIATYPAP